MLERGICQCHDAGVQLAHQGSEADGKNGQPLRVLPLANPRWSALLIHEHIGVTGRKPFVADRHSAMLEAIEVEVQYYFLSLTIGFTDGFSPSLLFPCRH
jgi:hypothetical protein